MVRSRCRWWQCAAGAALAAVAAAQSMPVLSVGERFRAVVRAYAAGEGLPQSTAQALFAARDGAMWIGTFAGLCRLDGTQWTVFDTEHAPRLPSDRIMLLWEDAAGDLWIAPERVGLARYRDGEVAVAHEFDDCGVDWLGGDEEGHALVATARGVFVAGARGFAPWRDQQLTGVRRLLRRRSGEWIAAIGDGLARIAASGPVPFAACDVKVLSETDDGTLWVGTNKGLLRYSGQGLVPFAGAGPLAGTIHALLPASDGALWAGTAAGAVRIARAAFDGSAPVPAGAAEGRAVLSLAQDREGGMWIGTREAGVARVRRAEVECVGSSSGLPVTQYSAVAGDGRGGLWVSTIAGLFHGDSAGNFAPVPLEHARDLLRDDAGSLWVGATGELVHLRGEEVQRIAIGSALGAVRALLRDGADLLIGTDHGLFRRSSRDGAIVPVTAALGDIRVHCLARAPDAALWIGATTGLLRIDAAGGIRFWRSGAELPPAEVRMLRPEAGERAWIATYGRGFVRVDGDRTAIVDQSRGLLDRFLCTVLVDGDQWFVSSNSGFFVLRGSDLDAVADGSSAAVACRPLAAESGWSWEGNGSCQDSAAVVDGRLYFCGIEALFALDPASIPPSVTPLPCSIDEVVVGARTMARSAVVEVPAGERSAIVRVATRAFDQPGHTRFRWRLGGPTAPWSDPTTDREIRLVGLRPGEHSLEVVAVDVAGGLSAVPARLSLRVAAQPWQRAGFWVAAVALALLTGWGLLRFGASWSARRARRLGQLVDERTQELKAMRDRLEVRVAERTAELRAAMAQRESELAQRQELERHLQQLQRMESLGQLAGGVAHDFNNLLTVVTGAAGLIPGESQAAVDQLCACIRDACERGRRLTHHLLAVASRQLVAIAPLDLQRTIEDLLPVLRPLLTEEIELRFVAPDRRAVVCAATAQIEQVLLNLAANARDAMPGGGLLTIALHVGPDAVECTVRDSGTGMPPEVRDRVFEPFFSTKAGSGRGLGLATVYGIVKQLRGTIAIDSAPGSGTCVRIRLPADSAPSAAPPIGPALVPARLEARVLLVEDDAAVREVLQRMLRRLGCGVVTAASGDLALQRLQGDEPFDVVISDVVMPGLQGPALVAAIRELRPGLPILFLSGYLDYQQTYRELLAMQLEVLAKPPTAAELAEAVHRAVAAPDGRRG